MNNKKTEVIHFMGELEENDNLLKSMKIWNVANKKWKWEPT